MAHLTASRRIRATIFSASLTGYSILSFPPPVVLLPPRNRVDIAKMGDSKPSKVWEPFSKMIKLPEEDWAVLESVYNDYRYRQGDLQRMEFVKRLVAKASPSTYFQLKSRT